MLDYKLIGNKIKFYRKEKKLTQFKLSEVLDVSDKYISLIERGKVKVSLSRLYEISHVLSVDISLLVDDRHAYSNIDNELLTKITNVVSKLDDSNKYLLINIIDDISKMINNNK